MSGRLDPKPIPRRDFLGIAGLVTAGIAILASLAGMARLPKPRVTPEASSRFRAGSPAEFPLGTVKIIPEHKVRIASTPSGIAAMSMVCTHLGCIVSETPAGFSCPCHGSKFALDGKVLSGPAPSRLPWLAVSQAADGTLVVDRKSQVEPGTYYSV
jgi:cytochrome b6-f complex iron-sulfur subunit